MSDLIIQSQRVVLPDGVQPARLTVRDGRIAAVEPWSPPRKTVTDVGDRVVMAGLVDSHVHINEPGRADWEGFETATQAAAAGGVTTIVDMPLNCVPPTLSAAALAEKSAVATSSAWVDIGFWGGVVPGNASDLQGLVEAGVLGFKCFLVDSAVPEFPPISLAELAEVMPRLARWDTPLLVHAEAPEVIERANRQFRSLSSQERRSYAAYAASRPAEAEDQAVEQLVELARKYQAPVHVLHVSSAGVLQAVREAKAAGLTLTAETCPHYLTFAAEEITDGATEFKCAPPIRDAENRERLWDGLRRGDLDLVVSDHSPCPAHLKEGDFDQAWGGISSLQLRLAATWTEARARGAGIEDLADWLAAGPARLAGLAHKGAISAGKDADLVIWDPDEVFVVTEESLLHRHPPCPYLGRRLYGVVETTFVGGNLVWDGELRSRPAGRLIAGRS
ncbi:MAG: allantoinase AllB [Acidimicrobiia bacterium]